jgi:hypothetical protein
MKDEDIDQRHAAAYHEASRPPLLGSVTGTWHLRA